MLRQLPRWAWLGGGVLAFIAGMVNAAGFMGFQHQSITNLTGSATLLGVAIGTGNGADTLHWLLAILSFLAGALASGTIVQQRTLQLGRRYGVALVLESALLFAAMPLLGQDNALGLYLASAAVGLQNGMASTFSGMVFRTTHVTGMFTDLGIYVGQRLRGLAVDQLRIGLSLLVIGAFVLGGVVGATLYVRLHEQMLWIPATLTGVCGALYALYSHRHRHERNRLP